MRNPDLISLQIKAPVLTRANLVYMIWHAVWSDRVVGRHIFIYYRLIEPIESGDFALRLN